MLTQLDEILKARVPHSWLHKVHIAPITPLINPIIARISETLLERFRHHGHEVQQVPDHQTDLLITSAPFNEPLDWRNAPLFNMRRRFDIRHTSDVLTLIHASPEQFNSLLNKIESALEREPPDPTDFNFPGLAPTAHRVLIEQGQRGGPILALERLLQSQSKSIRILLTIGNETPDEAYLFDLVGAHPRILYDSPDTFFTDIVLRTITAINSIEVTQHLVDEEPIISGQWRQSTIPLAMQRASLELGKRNFFTPMVRIADLVQVPAVDSAIASQYSEGCFATWEPELKALVATVTGSARPVDKGNLGDDDLSVIVDLRPDERGVIVRHVAGKRNDPPSSEAVEMLAMDRTLPRINLEREWGISSDLPIVRSKLHGHRGVASYNPQLIEHVPLDPAYYHFPVSCATDAQVRAIKSAFARSESLQDPDDPRIIVFTVLPGHGVFIAEKWVAGKEPFQVIWESMDDGFLEVENHIPQGLFTFLPKREDQMVLQSI
jgi:hypothetical protein